jgi:hypothetical protein
MKRRIILILLFLFANVTVLFAQLLGGPGSGACDNADPDTSDCPLDSWVIILVACALVFAVFHLYQKQKVQKIA